MIQTVCAFLSAAGAVERVGWVLVHSLWQFAVAAAATAVLHRSGAIVRHSGLASGLVAMAVLPVVTRWAVDVTPAPAGFTAPAAASAESPSTSSLRAAQLEAIIVQELAHVRRRDVVVNVLQAVLETLELSPSPMAARPTTSCPQGLQGTAKAAAGPMTQEAGSGSDWNTSPHTTFIPPAPAGGFLWRQVGRECRSGVTGPARRKTASRTTRSPTGFSAGSSRR